MTELQPDRDRPIQLRADLDTHTVDDGARSGVYLIDPLGVAEGHVFVPEALLPVVARFDGRHGIAQIEAALEADLAAAEGSPAKLPANFVPDLVRQFDEALMLRSDRFTEALENAVTDFGRAPVRPAAHAGSAGYPETPAACRDALTDIVAPRGGRPSAGALRGLVAPHIDLARGRAGYEAAYRRLADHAPADLYVVFGTGHQGPAAPVTGLTSDWETPLGRARTDRAFVTTVHDLLERPADRFDTFLHRREHSVEFQMLFLTHLLAARDEPFEVAGFLTGSLPEAAVERARIVDAFRQAAIASGKRVCFVAGADLAHIGPFFGDEAPVDDDLLARLDRDERARLAPLENGDPDAFWHAVEGDGNADRVCGTTPIYLTAAICGGPGELLHYGQAAAEDGSQVVSFCSVAYDGGA